MARALVIHGHFHDLGGAEHFCFRVTDVLQNRFDEVVVLHSGRSPDLALIEQRTGIALSRVRFISVTMPPLIQGLVRGNAQSFFLLQYAIVSRFARRIAPKFDLAVSTFAECPIRATHMIQNIHIPLLVSDAESLLYCGTPMSEMRRFAQTVYISLVKLIVGKQDLIAKQKTIANSEWTAGQFLRHYPDADVRAIYHGIEVGLGETSPDWIPFKQRANRLTMIGRIAPPKRVEEGIYITEGLRKRGHDIGLDIIGTGTGEYFQHIQTLAATRPWIRLHIDFSRAALETLAAGNKWGLHCYRFEHYGLAPGEMQALGCICFVHDSGGQREIIADSRQRYSDLEDAITKIDATLRSPELQSQLLARAKLAASAHHGAAFIRKFQALVEQTLTPQIGLQPSESRRGFRKK